MNITGNHQLGENSIAAKSGKLLLSGQPCGTGTCDNVTSTVNLPDTKIDFNDEGLLLSKDLGYLL